MRCFFILAYPIFFDVSFFLWGCVVYLRGCVFDYMTKYVKIGGVCSVLHDPVMLIRVKFGIFWG